ncbi:sensor histidine kinase [Paenibacillus aurantius]|uniref:Sensor histidine kinase n=1 Tax=Paenibacillus aurantius TaxID=2918900 RepID=A0AA96LLN0_9BACL|nr:sensor histidine kinase [Paenibacillus aurantius]WNQ13577.1 sensor histidine kinase [Paenibacillus aurantius]
MRSKINSLFVKLMLTFFVLIVPLYGLSVWFTNNSSGQMRGEIERSNESVLLFHYSTLQLELARMTSLLAEYSVDSQLADFSTFAPIMSNYEIDRRLNDILQKLRQMKSSSPYLEDVRYYLPLLNKVVSVRRGIADAPASEWRGLLASRANLRGNVLEYKGDFYLAKATPDSLDPTAAPNFLLITELSKPELAKQLRSIRKEGDGGAFISFEKNHLAVVSDARLQEKFSVFLPEENGDRPGKVIRSESEDGYFYAISDANYQFHLVSYVSKNVFLEPFRRYAFWMRSLTAVSCALIVVSTYGIYRLIHQPLFKLIRGFRSLERGDMSMRIEHRRGDEFGYLYSQFNQTLQRLHALIEDNYVQRIRTQDAELKHLQSQITPHFLYNSLFTIKQMAELENTEDIKIFSDYLGRYFRFMTRDFSKEVTLGEEMEHSLVYLHIQEIRFSNRMTVEAEPLPPECRPVMVPRIILQPILENVFKHGLAQKASGGFLRISHRVEEGAIVLTIEDNGDKLTDEALDGLREKLGRVSDLNEEGETTGLMNVHHRLQIRFGPEYGLSLSRSPLGGLRTEVNLPFHPNQKD